ncbi:MAG: DUF1385 domain-containing protein [Ruminococcaceae bacterium]|nr:DUF1385 domain-containing protein [Oscillospiraceae bacterium]
MAKVKRVSVGGQALIEGILMKGPKCSAMALRLPDGTIEVEEKKMTSLRDKNKFFAFPIVRGVVSFVESMIQGYKALMESAEKVSFEDIKNDDDIENMSKVDRWITEHFGEKMMTVISVISMILGFGLAFALFFYLPTLAADLLNKVTDGAVANFRALIEGVVRIIIFVAYMLLVSQMKDIKRMFMYHGAEHKSIFCFEAGKELTVENVREMSRLHPRCGTSFMFVMILISIVISSVISIAFPSLRNIRILWMAIKILLLPVVMGLGFEFIKFAGCHDNFFVKIVSAPGLWMQRITTNEPTDDIIEVGIAALKAALYGVEEKEETQPEVETEEQAESTAEETVESENEEAEETVAVEETPVAEEKEEDTYQKAQNIVDDLFAEILSEKKSDN